MLIINPYRHSSRDAIQALSPKFYVDPTDATNTVRDQAVIDGVTTNSVAALINKGNGSGYNLTQVTKNLQPDYDATGINSTPGTKFVTAASNATMLNFATGRDLFNNVAGVTIGIVLKLPAFGSSQRLLRFNNSTNSKSRLEILAITTARFQVGGTRLDADTVTSTAAANNSYVANTPFVLVAQLDYTGNALRAWVNGSQVINNTTWLNGTGAGTKSAATTTYDGILGHTAYSADWYAGPYCGFSHAESANIFGSTEITTITNTLKAKAGIA